MKHKHLLQAGLFTLMLALLFSCKKDTVDVTNLLSKIPSSAAGVVVVNSESLIEKSGCKLKDNVIKPGKEVEALLQKAGSTDKADFQFLFDGNGGIDYKAMVFFYDTNRYFVTFGLHDAGKFIQFVEEKTGETFKEDSGVKVCNNVAVKGAQAWVLLSQYKSLDPDAVAAYAVLKESQSFLVTPPGEKLLVEEDDIRGWARLDIFTNEIMPGNFSPYTAMGMGFIFNDAESVRFKLDFDKGEVETSMVVLNDDYKAAKFQIPMEKVNESTLKSIGGTCDAMMAFTVNSKLVKKLEQIGKTFGDAFFGSIVETLKNIDGTVGIVTSGDGIGQSVAGVITTNGNVTPLFRSMVSDNLGEVSEDGKLLRFSKGDVKGSLSVEECAADLKGCGFGVVVDGKALENSFGGSVKPGVMKSLVIRLESESGGLEIEGTLKTTSPKENALLTLIK